MRYEFDVEVVVYVWVVVGVERGGGIEKGSLLVLCSDIIKLTEEGRQNSGN